MGYILMDERRRLTRLLIDNLERNTTLRLRLPRVATDADAECTKGADLLETLETRIKEKDELEGKLAGMWETMHSRHETVWATFLKHRNRAIEELTSAELITTLELAERQATGRPGQLLQMSDFYSKLLDIPAALALLDATGLTKARLILNRDAVRALEDYESDILMVEITKQSATKAQHDALEAMDAWREDLYDRIELVTKDAPHLRKAVGLTVRE